MAETLHETQCSGCERWGTVYRMRGMTVWLCRQCAGTQLRAEIKGWLAPDLTPAMEMALREWIDRVGATSMYLPSRHVFTERTNQGAARRKSCDRLAATGYLEADPTCPTYYIPPYRVTDKALALLEITREQSRPSVAVVDDGCPF